MRYIDADKLREDILGLPNCYNGFSDTYDKALIIDRIDEQPTADVVEVVKCRDCKHLDKGENDSESWCECTAHFGKYFEVSGNDYCSFGEKA